MSSEHEGKRVKMINVCRTPTSLSNGVCCSLAQWNRIDGKMNLISLHQKETCNAVDHVKNHPEISNIMLEGDLNQYLNENEVKRFVSK